MGDYSLGFMCEHRESHAGAAARLELVPRFPSEAPPLAPAASRERERERAAGAVPNR